MFKFKIKRYFFNSIFSLWTLIRWTVISLAVGIIVGGTCTFFAFVLLKANALRDLYPMIAIGLPAAGLIIVFLYKNFQNKDDLGTNLIIASIRNSTDIPFRMAPMIFISTALTQLCGGSAGREGAAIQLGGCLGNTLGKLFHLNSDDRHIITMCGNERRIFCFIRHTDGSCRFFTGGDQCRHYALLSARSMRHCLIYSAFYRPCLSHTPGIFSCILYP